MSDWENNAARLINELSLMVSMAGNFAREPDKRPMSDKAIIRSLRESQESVNEILAYMTKSAARRGDRRVSLDPQMLWETAQRASEDALTADTYRASLYGAIVVTLADTAIRTVELLRLKCTDVISEGPEGGPVLAIRGKGQMCAPFLQPCSKRAYLAIFGCIKASEQCNFFWSFDDWALVHPKGSKSKGDAAQLAVPGQLTRGIVRQAVDAYFPGMTPHDLRHARLTAWADAGVPVRYLAPDETADALVESVEGDEIIERMKIVAWIRDHPYQHANGLADIADAIERGDHRKENEE